MHTWTDLRWLALAAGLAILGCEGTTPHLDPLFGPGEAYPNAVTDDGDIKRSMAEGGQSDQPYVVDGTVQSLTAHTVLIETNQVGNRQLLVNRHTEITVDGKPAAFSAIRPGTRIRAAYGLADVAYALQAGQGCHLG